MSDENPPGLETNAGQILLSDRRRFIRDELQAKGRVAEEDLKKKFHGYSLKAIRNDISIIEKYDGKNIFEHRDDETGLEWIDDSRKFGSTREQRKLNNAKAKREIAQILSTLLLGFNEFEIPNVKGKAKYPPRQSIKDYLKGFLGNPPVGDQKADCDLYIHHKNKRHLERLNEKLKNFWGDSERSLFLDGGTTTETFAEQYLQYVLMPFTGTETLTAESNQSLNEEEEEQPVNKIEVITNDRYIFYSLGEPTVHTKTIMVGGRQQFRGSVTSGMMAEKFLEVNGINAGLAFVATTAICLDRENPGKSYFCAENEHVASLKLKFLKRSGLRVIVADSTKFVFRGSQGDTRIGLIKRKEIDLVVTNDASQDVLAVFKSLGVPLLSYNHLFAPIDT